MRQTNHNDHVDEVLKSRMEATYILWRLLKEGNEPKKGKHVQFLVVVNIESAAR